MVSSDDFKKETSTSGPAKGSAKRSIADALDRLAEGIADVKYAESFRTVVTLKECIDFCKESRRQYPEVNGFIVTVQKNFDPRNENDIYIIMVGLLDVHGKPISADGVHALSRTLHTRTIDESFVNFLDGEDKKICMFNKKRSDF